MSLIHWDPFGDVSTLIRLIPNPRLPGLGLRRGQWRKETRMVTECRYQRDR